jgi:hypothetical protein
VLVIFLTIATLFVVSDAPTAAKMIVASSQADATFLSVAAEKFTSTEEAVRAARQESNGCRRN